MADLSTTKVFSGLPSIATTDLDAIIPQTSIQPAAITSKPAAGATSDTDLFLCSVGGALQQTTALKIKTYLGQVFVPSNVSQTSAVGITTSAPVLSPTFTQLVASIVITTIAGASRKLMGWGNVNWQSGTANSGVNLWVYRQDNVQCASVFFNTRTAGDYYCCNFQWVDSTPLSGSTTYYMLAQAVTGPGIAQQNTLSGVQM